MFHLVLALTTLVTDYRFATPDHKITMKVQFEQPYRGRPLAFYQGDKRHCYGGRCLENFHGAVAIVRFAFAKARAKAPKPAELREVVTILEQSDDLPPANPLDLKIPIKDGLASDLQVMGYDEDGLPQDERSRMRAEAPARMWRRVRQELYLNGAARPFAVIVWKHGMDGIELLSATNPAADH
jgi:hypothetical protein